MQDGSRRVIEAADAAAAALGLRPGMAVAQAVAVVPGLHVLDADPAEDIAALERLARWCQRATPLAATDAPGGIWLDVAGCTHLWGGEQALLDHLAARLAQDGVTAHAAIADTPGAAHALARNGGGIIAQGAQEAAIAPLPVAALRLPAEMVATLRRLGFERIGALARIPRALLARRFGPEPGRRIDQAHGAVAEPLQPLPHESKLQHRIAFLEPLLTAEALSTATTHLLEPLCSAMERAGLGARRLDLLFERVDGTVQATRIGTARPNRDARHLTRLLDERIEQVDPGLGVEAMRLVVGVAEPLVYAQEAAAFGEVATNGVATNGAATNGAATDEPSVAELVDRLQNRLGPERVWRAAPVESDVPERSVRRIPPLTPSTGATWSAALPRPSRLLDPPQLVEAMALLPDQPPVAFTWRRRRHRVRRADGPERIHGEWWRRDTEVAAVRDYFRVEDEGGDRFWLFRRGDGADPATGDLRWFLHGIF